MAIFSKLGKYQDTGLLLMRIGVGAMMMTHGIPKLAGGTEKWVKLGKNMELIGIHAYPAFWGFMAGFAEGICGALFVLGFLFRPAAFLMLFTMFIAAFMHIHDGTTLWEKITDASHAIELGSVFIAMFLIGPGRFSVDKS